MTFRAAAVATSFAAIAAFGVAGCGGSGSGQSLDVGLRDHKVELGSSTAKAGDTTFDVTNHASQTHEFVVTKTDLAPNALPVDEDGAVDERGQGITFVDEVEDIKAGKSAGLKVELSKGTYVLLCNLEDHYKRGMYTTLTVD